MSDATEVYVPDWLDAEPIAEHPAKFNADILGAIRDAIFKHYDSRGDQPNVLDPFGGVGRIHRLSDVAFTFAVELQPGWAAQSAREGPTWCGDWLDFRLPAMFWRWSPHIYPTVTLWNVDVVATSCTYGNRMADKHKARENSKRLTYAHTLRRNGEEMLDDNSGGMQWGEQYRVFHTVAWAKVYKMLGEGGLFVLNVKDHVRKGRLQKVPEWHRDTILGLGMELIEDRLIPVTGMGFGANQTADEAMKLDYEHVYVFRKVSK